MKIIYCLISLLCNAALLRCICSYYACWAVGSARGRKVTIAACVLGFVGFSLAPLPASLALRNLLTLFLCLFLSFLHTMGRLQRCISAALLWGILCGVNLFLIRISGAAGLHLFAAPGFHSALGSILFLSLVWLCLLPFGILGEHLAKKKPEVLQWIPRFCLPVSMVLLCALALLFEVNQNDLIFNFAGIEILADVDRPDLLFYVSCGGLLLLNVLIPYLCQRLSDLKEEQREKSLIAQQNEYFQNQFTLLQSSSEEIRGLRHDLRNHLTAVRAVISPEDKQASEYLDVLLGDFAIKEEISSTGNLLLDSLVNYKFRNCRAEKLNVSYHAAVPEDLPAGAWDLTVILGNLIDNAIEAAKKCPEGSRNISLALDYQRGCLKIDITNSYTGLLRPSEGGYDTTKPDEAGHGIGLQNVRRAAEKNGGTFSFGPQDGLFRACVVLQL